MKAFESISEVTGWIRIALSPLAIGLALGWILYYNMQNSWGMILGIFTTALGLIMGIYWATKAWKGKGTVYTATRHMQSPDLDKQDNEK